MKIWIDGDACPKPIKEMAFRAADKRQIPLCIVANSWQRIPPSKYLKLKVVGSGFDEADHYLVDHAGEGDIAITSDIPLAYELVQRQVRTLSPKGEVFTAANIGERLAMRNLLAEFRSAGEISQGSSAFSARDKQAFADAFDRLLAT